MSKNSPPKPDICLQFADCLGFDEAATKGLNFVFSTLSIRVALSLAFTGAKGPTLDQFLSFLGSNTLDGLNSATEKLLASVRTTGSGSNCKKQHGDGGSHLSLANSIWVGQELTLKPSFVEIAS